MLKVFKMMVEAQGGLAGLPNKPISSHFTASLWKPGVAQGRCREKALAVPKHAAPCTGSLLISKLHPFGLASLWGSSLFPGTSFTEQPEQGLSE